MNGERDDLEAILSELVAARAHADELLVRLEALLNGEVPAHIARVFARAREVFGRDATHFLATPHWALAHQMPLRVAHDAEGARRVEDLLARISSGIPV